MHNPSGFVLLTDQEYINTLLENFKTAEDVNVPKLQEFFGHKMVKTGEHTFGKISHPRYFTSDEFILKKGTLPNVFKDTETSVGLYIFNLLCISSIFGDKIEYFNPKQGLTPKNIEKVQQIIIDLLIVNKVTGDQFAEFQTSASWLGYRGTLWNAGQSFEFAKVNPDVAAAKPKLLAEWHKVVESGKDPISTYVVMVEKPLLEIAKNSLKNSEAWPIYARGGKPKFGNVYKNCAVSMGPIFDPITGTYKVAENSFMEGIDNNMIPTFANIQIDAAYNRAVATQDGGAKTKQLFAALQSIKLDPNRNSDCGSKRYVIKTITDDNFDANLLRYILDEKTGNLIKLTKENLNEFKNKEVKMRSSMYCNNDNYCNKCAGDYFYEIGLINIGNTTPRISSTLMNRALKSMHDISVNADFINPLEFMRVLR